MAKKKDYSVKRTAIAGPSKRQLTPFEKALIKAKGDPTKIPGFQWGKGTE